MNEEVSRLKASEEIHKVASSKREEDVKMKDTLEQQISQHREQHQKQVKKEKYTGNFFIYRSSHPSPFFDTPSILSLFFICVGIF